VARTRGKAAAGTAVERVADRVHSAAIHLLRRLRREDDASGMSAPRLSVLSVLVFGGTRTIGRLAAAEQVTPPTMTRLVQALEREGLVRREADPSDGRAVRVRETTRGRRLLLAARQRRLDALGALLAELTPAELALVGEASTLLERLLADGLAGGGTAAGTRP
jgi:DNA-binding MarR family transcriptional regulator